MQPTIRITKDAALHVYGGKARELARAMNITPSAVSQWGRLLPAQRSLELQHIVRPDIDWPRVVAQTAERLAIAA